MRLMSVFALCLCSLGSLAREMAVNLPLDLEQPGVAGDAELATQADGSILWTLPPAANSATVEFDLEALGILPHAFDELRIEFKTEASLVAFEPRLLAYPVNDICRNWYSKIALEPGEWAQARFDLRLDDDGAFFSRRPMDTPTLALKLNKRWLRHPGEPQERRVHIRRLQFVRYPARLDYDPTEAVLERDGDTLAWIYRLRIQNRETEPLRARLRFDDSRLEHFRCEMAEWELDLAPREARVVSVRLAMPAEVAAALPLFHSEPVEAVLDFPGTDAPSVSPLLGYRPNLLWATVPPEDWRWIPPPLPEEKRAAALAAADNTLAERWGVPVHGPSGHPQSYIDPASNQPPTALSWFRHLGRDGNLIDSDRVTTAYVGHIHAANFARANLLAQAWQASGDLRYAVAAREVFLEYCHWYPYLPATSPASTSGRTRLHQSTLQTCFWFAGAIDAYARIKDSPALGEADRERIENEFFRPELRAIYGHNVEYTNMQVHHYEIYTRGVLALGRHWNLVGEALHGAHGFHRMIERSFTEDGLAHETGVYHPFTLAPMMEFVERMDEFGIDVMGPRFQRVFDGTVANTPDGVVRLRNLARFYPRAYQSYRNPAYIPTLRALGQWPPPGLSAEEAAAEEAKVVPLVGNTHQSANGYLWLRETGPWGLHALSINYIMTRDRLEFDRLHVELYDPDRLTHEVFRITYGAGESRLMYRTMAHNTVVVDRQDQLPLPARLAVFHDRPSLPAALFTEEPGASLWPEVEFARCVAILDGVFFVGDLYHGREGEHDFDWPFYAPWEPWVGEGVGVIRPSVVPDQPIDLGYEFLTGTEAATTSDGFTAWADVPRFQANSGRPESRARAHRRLHLAFAPMPGAEVVTGLLPRGHRPQPGPAFLVRQPARRTAAFGVALDSTAPGESSRVQSVERLPLSPDIRAAAWRVAGERGTYLVVINRTGQSLTVADRAVEGELLVERLP